MTISLIAAASENNVIGKNNKLIWKLPADMNFFKTKTLGHHIIMGRKTFESVSKILPGRFNIVITTQPNWNFDGALVTNSLQDALDKALVTNCNEAFIIGGGEIYKQSMEMANTIFLTRVHTTIDGDTFFPEIDETKWQLVSNEDFEIDEKHAFSYSFQKWEKK